MENVSNSNWPSLAKDLKTVAGILRNNWFLLIVDSQIWKPKRLPPTYKQWDPIAEAVFHTLKQALLQVPALSLSTGNDFSLYVMEKSGVALGVLTQTQDHATISGIP
ncbi:hypothetical protein AAY473_001703, partial [Plecturocebus cupreus]